MQNRNGSANGHARMQNGNTKLQRKGLHRSTPVQAEQQISYLHSSSVLPAFLIIVCPIFAVMLTYTQVVLKGDVSALMQMIRQEGVAVFVQRSLLQHLLGNSKAWTFIGCFAVFELILMRVIPGKRMTGPVTPKGNVPVYKANGLQVYFITLATFISLAYFKIFNPVDIYDNFPYIIGALCCFSLIIVFGLYLKGRFAPSSTDNSVSGAFFFDYFWGSELYPRVFGWDIKLFTNCRFGMMSWALLVICYAWKQYDSYGQLSESMAVSVALQLIYITKFFHWEMGYMRTLDIMHDRAGFMICWGCLVWVPSFYTSPSLYLVHNQVELGLPLAAAIFVIGVAGIVINYHADYQKEIVRATDGNCTIWGRKPAIIRTTYQTTEGETKKSLLVLSGWWGVSRHFHYIPELLAAFCWSVPALLSSVIPYMYFMFLFVLLTHRAVRDDKRCEEKYKKFWKEYCRQVPYKILPWVF